MMSLPVWLSGPMFLLGGVVLREGIVLGGCGRPPNRQAPPEVGTPSSGTRKAGGTQPTQMLSCAKKYSVQ